jgi:hypothetical protein
MVSQDHNNMFNTDFSKKVVIEAILGLMLRVLLALMASLSCFIKLLGAH